MNHLLGPPNNHFVRSHHVREMAIQQYLCNQGVEELRRDRAFDDTKRCKIIDIRLKRASDSFQGRPSDNFIPGYSPAKACDSQPKNILAWAQDEASHIEAVSKTHNGRLLVAYHVWDECKKKPLPFACANSFKTFLRTLGLSCGFAWDFARKTAVPLWKQKMDEIYCKF